MATTVGRVEIEVDADGGDLVRQMRVIGRRAGNQMGGEMGKSLTNSFNREVTHFDKDGGITKIRESFKTLDKDWEKVSANFGTNSRRMGGHLGVLRGHVARTIGAWTLLVAVIGQGTAVLGSGLSAALTSLISSLGVGLVGALGLAGAALSGIIIQIALAGNSMRFLRDEVPAVGSALDSLSSSFEASGRRFAQAWGPSVARFLETLNAALGNTAIIDAFAASLSKITDAFSAVFTSPGGLMFMKALESTIPNALASLGTGFASLTGGLAAVFAGAAPELERFAGVFAAWADNWQKTMEAMAADGRLQEFFALAGQSIEAIFGLVGSLGGALMTLFQAGASSGNALLDKLSGIFDKWNEWMQSVEGQNALEEWFANGEKILSAVFDLLGDLGTVLADLVTPQAVESLVTFLDSLGQALPILGQIIGLVGDLQVLNIFAELLNLVSAILTPLMPVLSEFATTLGTILLEAVAELAPVFADLATQMAPVVEAIGELIIALLPPLIDIVIAVIENIAAWVTIFSALDDAFGKNDESTSTWKDIVFGAFQIIGGIITTSIDAWTFLLNLFSDLLTGDFSGAFQTMYDFVVKIFDNFGLKIEEVLTWGQQLATDFGRFLGDIGRELGNFGDTVADIFGGVVGWIQDAIGWLGQLFGAASNAGNAVSGARSRSNGGGTSRPMASGGRLFGPTRILAGESGPEAIVPLRRSLSQVDPSVRFLSAVAQGKMPAMASGGIVGGGRQVIFQSGAIVVQGSGNPEAVAVGVLNRAAERLS